MKLLLDQGVPRSTASLLRSDGFDAVHTGECGLSTATDAEILAVGRSQNRHIVTLDSDFHTIIALSGVNRPSVVRVRIEGLRAVEMARLITDTIQLCAQDLELGALVSVEEDRVRLRRLPITREFKPC
ncbi:MAG: hypothetical protein DRQ48_08585 [Gammaproteobacteria bacterium]|nr:MAG: hypothetical protein DRQ48_08585 [Gammaproteobacteria bacterium]